MRRNAERLLRELRVRGARDLRRVVFKETRRTIFSLTGGGTVLNLNVAFRQAPEPVVDALAVVARPELRGTPVWRVAARQLRDWPPVQAALERARRHRRAARRGTVAHRRRVRGRGAACCATPAQLVYLQTLYRRLNESKFGGRLPSNVRLRLSNRMRNQLGQIRYSTARGRRRVLEIALNVDLMLGPNHRHRVDTLLHEMAHAEAFLFHGEYGHGPRWREIAERVGCEARASTRLRVARRPRGASRVTRVPRRAA